MMLVKRDVHILRLIILLIFLPVTFLSEVNGQNITLGVSGTYDQNIFDTYRPLKDLVTEVTLAASKGWGFETSYLGGYYGGTLALYRDLTARNYHSHVGVVSWIYHFPPSLETEEEESSEDSDDGALAESDSTETDFEGEAEEEEEDIDDEAPGKAEDTPEAVHSDSLDRYLTISAIGGSQFNKVAYEQWNHSSANGIVTFRQPLGRYVSIRPSYSIIYHSYPNLSVLTNIQHVFNLHLGTDLFPKSWVSVTGSFGHKVYVTRQTGQDTVYIVKPGHGKGGEIVTDTVVQYDFTTPSLSQPWISGEWVYRPWTRTIGTFQLTYYFNPTRTARALPTLRSGASVVSDFDQNELYDDHFSFNGVGVLISVRQSLPLNLILRAACQYQHKKYTYGARNLVGEVVSPNRIDDRLQISAQLSRSFSLGKGSGIRLRGEYHYLRNSSNAAYFIFNKNKFAIGVAYSF